MILKDKFYIISEIKELEAGKIQASINIDEKHEIFNGHFPGMPVVPGVCMLTIIKEILSFQLKRDFILRSAGNLKFLSILNPKENPEVEVNINFENKEGNIFIPEATILSGAITFLKANSLTLQ